MPYQIQAFALKLFRPSSKDRESALSPLKLPCNEKLFSSNGEGPDITFSYPRELVPEKITSGDIIFQLNKKGKDTLACCGEEISINDASCNMLSMLIAAEEETPAIFSFIGSGEKRVEITIPAYTGFIGQYDTRQWKRKSRWKRRDYFWHIPCTGVIPGYIKRDEVAFYTTHIHSHGKDLPYRFGYMFRVDIEIPEGTEAFRLCDNRKVKIFAITLSRKESQAEPCRYLIDEFDY